MMKKIRQKKVSENGKYRDPIDVTKHNVQSVPANNRLYLSFNFLKRRNSVHVN
jgi:hypothetical protein